MLRIKKFEGGEMMGVVKVIELVGISDKSWEDAVNNAVAVAAKSVRNIVGIDVVGMKGRVENGKLSEFKADVKVAFIVE